MGTRWPAPSMHIHRVRCGFAPRAAISALNAGGQMSSSLPTKARIGQLMVARAPRRSGRVSAYSVCWPNRRRPTLVACAASDFAMTLFAATPNTGFISSETALQPPVARARCSRACRFVRFAGRSARAVDAMHTIAAHFSGCKSATLMAKIAPRECPTQTCGERAASARRASSASNVSPSPRMCVRLEPTAVSSAVFTPVKLSSVSSVPGT